MRRGVGRTGSRIDWNYNLLVHISELSSVMASVNGLSLEFSDNRAVPDTADQ